MKYLKESRIIKGSLQKKKLKCGNPGCHCHKKGGKGHGPYAYLAVVVKGKTQPFLLKKWDIPVVNKYIDRHRKLRKEVEIASQKNVRLLHQGRLR